LKTREKMNKILSENTNQTLEKIKTDVERDFYMDADEAMKYGIVDRVYVSREEAK
jgi:ATP-dependent Clp protease protease subunit